MADPLGVHALRVLLADRDADCTPLLDHLTVRDLSALTIACNQLSTAAHNERNTRLRRRSYPRDPQFADEWAALDEWEARIREADHG